MSLHQLEKNKNVRYCAYIPITKIVGTDTWFFEDLAQSEPPFSWGDNDRTLIDPSRLLEQIEDIETDNSVVSKEQGMLNGQCETLRRMKNELRSLMDGPVTVYVDLEN